MEKRGLVFGKPNWKLKYTTEKPKDGRFYFLPSSTEVVDPDGGKMLVEWMPDFDEDMEPVKDPPGTEYFGYIRAWIPKEDAKKGIYVAEEDYDKWMDEIDRLDEMADRERQGDDGNAGDGVDGGEGEVLSELDAALGRLKG